MHAPASFRRRPSHTLDPRVKKTNLSSVRIVTSIDREPSLDELQRMKEDFILKYHIVISSDLKKVSFTIPQELSVITFLKEAQALFGMLHNNKKAILPDHLKVWSRDKDYSKEVSENTRIVIDVNFDGTLGKSRERQLALLNEQKLLPPEMLHLAAAHAACLIARDGKNLFGNLVVRHKDGAFQYKEESGLVVYTYCDNDARDYIAMAADWSEKIGVGNAKTRGLS